MLSSALQITFVVNSHDVYLYSNLLSEKKRFTITASLFIFFISYKLCNIVKNKLFYTFFLINSGFYVFLYAVTKKKVQITRVDIETKMFCKYERYKNSNSYLLNKVTFHFVTKFWFTMKNSKNTKTFLTFKEKVK